MLGGYCPSQGGNIYIYIIYRITPQGMTHSVQATDRIMKELKEIYKSDNYKTGVYSVAINNDNLYKWDVYLKKYALVLFEYFDFLKIIKNCFHFML